MPCRGDPLGVPCSGDPLDMPCSGDPLGVPYKGDPLDIPCSGNSDHFVLQSLEERQRIVEEEKKVTTERYEATLEDKWLLCYNCGNNDTGFPIRIPVVVHVGLSNHGYLKYSSMHAGYTVRSSQHKSWSKKRNASLTQHSICRQIWRYVILCLFLLSTSQQ